MTAKVNKYSEAVWCRWMRDVFNCIEATGDTDEEIASKLSCSPSNVSKYRHAGAMSRESFIRALLVYGIGFEELPPLPDERELATTCCMDAIDRIYESLHGTSSYITAIEFREIIELFRRGFPSAHETRRVQLLCRVRGDALISREDLDRVQWLSEAFARAVDAMPYAILCYVMQEGRE